MPFWPSSIDILSFGTYIAFSIVRAGATKAKAAIEREQSEVRFDSAEFEQARPKVKALRTYVKLKV